MLTKGLSFESHSIMNQLGAISGRTLCPSQVTQRAGSRRPQVIVASFKVRPYTVRKGDTLGSIAKKREIRFEELVALNHDMNPDSLVEGQTILLPGGKLSSRDREILAGIGPATYRTYPVREGEALQDIMEKRNITRSEMDALNPGIDLDHLSTDQVLKLPAGKYTVREREMMTGSGVLPTEFFHVGSALGKTVLIALGVAAIYSAFLWRQKQEPDDDSE